MRKAIRHLYKLVVAGVIIAVLTAVNIAPADAATHPCKLGVNTTSMAKMDFGKNIPVILIHGIFGSPADWTLLKGSSVCSDIDTLPGVQVALNFKYKTDHWNTIAKSFASQINKIAAQSAKNGGVGKVIIVSFSQGTIITRTAINAHNLDPKVGQVVTIAAPAGAANPWDNYPSNVVVRAIGGDITNAIVKGKKTTYKHTKSDGLLGLNQTLKRYTNNPKIGGGRVTAQCTKTYKNRVGGKKLKPFNELCDHGNLLKNPVVLKSVLAGVSAYTASIKSPKPPTGRPWAIGHTTTDVTLYLNSKWGEVETTTDTRYEGSVSELNTSRYIMMSASEGYTASDLHANVLGSWLIETGEAPTSYIGNRKATVAVSVRESGEPAGYGYLWFYEPEGIIVMYLGMPNPQSALPSTLKEVLESAVWAHA